MRILVRSTVCVAFVAVVGCGSEEETQSASVDAGVKLPEAQATDAVPSKCAGHRTDGILEGAEECDDGNELEGDGCTATCKLDCEGVIDRETGTCYWVAANEEHGDKASARCEQLGNDASVVSIRSKREHDVVVHWLERLEISSVFAGLVLAPDGVTWTAFAQGAPGWSTTCPGCFANWGAGQPEAGPTKRFAVMDLKRAWAWGSVEETQSAGVVCERPRPGKPINLCKQPECDPAVDYATEIENVRLLFRSKPQSYEGAEAQCKQWGGTLATLGSETIRKALVRYGFKSPIWLGAKRTQGGSWKWADGVSVETRPIPWGASPIEDAHVVTALGKKPSYDTNLVEGRTATGQLPFVCGKKLKDGTGSTTSP